MLFGPSLSKYPELRKFIRGSLLKRAKTNAKTWRAFKKFGELSESRAQTALTVPTGICGYFKTWFYDYTPRLEVEQLKGQTYGVFRGSKNDSKIIIDKDLAAAFEKNPNSADWQKVVEATLLHEAVHWGDWKDGKDRKGEEGMSFEKAAYGKTIWAPQKL